jgi:hypothetical protein
MRSSAEGASAAPSRAVLDDSGASLGLVRCVEELLAWEAQQPCPEMPWALRSHLEAAARALLPQA